MTDPTPPGSTDKTHTVTVYVAAPGTPIQQPGSDETQRSRVGHVYYSISDGQIEQGYGFSPIESGARGPGRVVQNEHRTYEDPVYSRTMEISESQYDALNEFGQAGLKNQGRYFNFEYHGVTNSCIDFTWAALNHAGLHLEHQLPFGHKLQDKDYEGGVKPRYNIQEFQRIPDPVPGSPHNREQENPLPEREWWQRLIGDNGAQPDATREHARLDVDPADRKPFADPVLNQLHAALQNGDSKTLDQIGRQFNQSEEGVRLAERGEQLRSEQQAAAQPDRQQVPAMMRG